MPKKMTREEWDAIWEPFQTAANRLIAACPSEVRATMQWEITRAVAPFFKVKPGRPELVKAVQDAAVHRIGKPSWMGDHQSACE